MLKAQSQHELTEINQPRRHKDTEILCVSVSLWLVLSVLSSSSPSNPGKNYFGFALVTNTGEVVTGASPQVWIAKEITARPSGPFPATWYPFAPASDFNDTAPRSALPGTYATTLDVSGLGNWIVGVSLKDGSHRFFGQAVLQVSDDKLPGALGSKAVSTKTPVAHTLKGLRQICTRPPPDPLHRFLEICPGNAGTDGKTCPVFGLPRRSPVSATRSGGSEPGWPEQN